MKRIGRMAACVAAVFALAAHAEPDTFGLGTGRDGALTVSGGNRVVNSYAQVTAPLAPGDTTITVGNASGFAAGDLVMVLQTTGIVPTPPSGQQPAGGIDISSDPVGRWELARVQSVSGLQVTLTAPLIHSFAASVTQLIRVPEYTDVTVFASGTITADPWNGSIGGVVAFLATGVVSVNGSINVNGRGFRGGIFVNGSSNNGCTGLDQPAPDGAQKGEGLSPGLYAAAATGRGNVTNGAGGGVCHNAGGGGGGNGGAGGIGGRSWSGDGSRNVGGMGGWNLKYSLLDHLTFGGGGGAAHGNNNFGTSGGRGGGAIFIRAGQLSGLGTISANGASGGT
ncbi:MAG: adhesin, partial [Myxococcaceae bacterium]|nr:adhesin [Myxococcaceae bacterium]